MANVNWDDFTPDTGVNNLVAAITHVESGGNADAVSPQGASGSMQIMPGTFNQYAKLDENYSNDSDRRIAAIRKINDDLTHYDGDTAKAAAAYIGGRGAVLPDGTIRNDVADSLGTTPMKYAGLIMGKINAAPQVNWDDFTPVQPAVNWDDFTPVKPQGFLSSAIDSVGGALKSVQDWATSSPPENTDGVAASPAPDRFTYGYPGGKGASDEMTAPAPIVGAGRGMVNPPEVIPDRVNTIDRAAPRSVVGYPNGMGCLLYTSDAADE